MIRCPYCKSDDVDRIGLYTFRCNSCDEHFDVSEINEDVDITFPDEEETDD